jgi:hypothetical protein
MALTHRHMVATEERAHDVCAHTQVLFVIIATLLGPAHACYPVP